MGEYTHDYMAWKIPVDPEGYDPPTPLPPSVRGHAFITRLGKRVCRDCSCPETAGFATANCPGAVSDYLCARCQNFVPENAPCPYCHQ